MLGGGWGWGLWGVKTSCKVWVGGGTFREAQKNRLIKKWNVGRLKVKQINDTVSFSQSCVINCMHEIQVKCVWQNHIIRSVKSEFESTGK